jgi:ATP-dependent exoDNAse (exonuclease V) beta subunit
MIRFDPDRHAYVTDNNEEYLSVTKLLSKYKPAFDAETAAAKASKNRKSKWYKMDPEQIKQVWKQESERSTTLGNWYHDQREKDLLECETISYEEYTLPIYTCKYNTDGYKTAGDQKLVDGVYPEHFIYLPSMKIAGQSDKVTVAGGKVDILDYKTNKEIKTQGFRNYEGVTQKMLFPMSHLDDCNLNHYALQLSIYMYIILKHNPLLRAGNLTLQHIIFEEDFDKDPYGYPIYLRDANGNPIIKDVIPYKVPYLKDEVITLLQDYTLNKIKK